MLPINLSTDSRCKMLDVQESFAGHSAALKVTLIAVAAAVLMAQHKYSQCLPV